MTTIRKWGVQLGGDDAGSWVVAEYECDGLERALLCDSPIRAARIASAWGLSTVRSVLVTQEGGGWEYEDRISLFDATPANCVVVAEDALNGPRAALAMSIAPSGAPFLTTDLSRAVKFISPVDALTETYKLAHSSYHGDYVSVWSVRHTSPRETRVPGRTLDELLASVPAEANHDD